MKNTLNIGKAVYAILSNDNNTKKLVKNAIYPLVANHGEKFPFITYTRTSLTPNRTKDSIAETTAMIEIDVYSDKYKSVAEVATSVFEALEGFEGEAGGFNIDEVTLEDASEEFDDDTFKESLIFKFEIL